MLIERFLFLIIEKEENENKNKKATFELSKKHIKNTIIKKEQNTYEQINLEFPKRLQVCWVAEAKFNGFIQTLKQ